MTDIELVFRSQAHASKKLFPLATIASDMTKIKEEADEVIKDPHDIEEYADVLLCFASAVSKSNFTLEEIVEEAARKISKNKQRTWEHIGKRSV